jgi:hypothetical protein
MVLQVLCIIGVLSIKDKLQHFFIKLCSVSLYAPFQLMSNEKNGCLSLEITTSTAAMPRRRLGMDQTLLV